MNLHNVMEDIVKSCLKDLSAKDERLTVCEERQLLDIMAITLNRLPAKYVVTTKGEVFAKSQVRSQVESDVLRELEYAINKVLTTPRDPAFEG